MKKRYLIIALLLLGQVGDSILACWMWGRWEQGRLHWSAMLLLGPVSFFTFLGLLRLGRLNMTQAILADDVVAVVVWYGWLLLRNDSGSPTGQVGLALVGLGLVLMCF